MAAYSTVRLISAAALAVTGITGAPSFAANPSLLWSDARNVAVHCLVQSTSSRSPVEFERALCNRVRTLAKTRSRLPVTVVEAGDPAFVRADTVVLLVHASVEPLAGGRMIAFTIRPYRPSGGDAEVYFGAAPKASFGRGGWMDRALDSQIRAAVSEIFPSHPTPR